MKKSIKKPRSITRIAGPDDPIYKQGWTISTVGVWGRLPKPYPEPADAIRETGLPADKEGTDEQE